MHVVGVCLVSIIEPRLHIFVNVEEVVRVCVWYVRPPDDGTYFCSTDCCGSTRNRCWWTQFAVRTH